MRDHLDDEVLARIATSVPTPGLDEDAARAHLTRCRSCQRRSEDLRAVRFRLRSLSDPPVPSSLTGHITGRVSEPSSRSAPPARRDRFGALEPRHLGFAAATALA